jgi:hypothetical protein
VDNLLTIALWIAAIALLLGAVLFFAGRWIAIRLVRRLAEQTERRIASRLDRGLRQTGFPARRELSDAQRQSYLAQIDRTARLMDRLIPLPGGAGIGLDALLGVVPIAGDLASFAASTLILVRAAQLGAPERLLTQLIAIACTDLAIGAVPVIGDLVDVAYQANIRSARLVREFVEEQTSNRTVDRNYEPSPRITSTYR